MKEEHGENEPLILWWMPVIALLAPLLFAAWKAVSADSNVVEKTFIAFFWPGVGLYAATLAVLWGGWKIDLE